MNDVWMTRGELMEQFKKNLWFQHIQASLTERTPHLSLDSIDAQLSHFDDCGLIILKTDTDKFEEFAVRKFNGEWKFSSCTSDIEGVKYAEKH